MSEDKNIIKCINELNAIAEQRKAIYDQLWLLEERTQTLRKNLNDYLKKEDKKHGSNS